MIATSKWCTPCGTSGRPTPATLILENDPYCMICARVAGYSGEEIAKGAKSFLVPAPKPINLRELASGAFRKRAADRLAAFEAQDVAKAEPEVPTAAAECPAECPAEPQVNTEVSQEEADKMSEHIEPEWPTAEVEPEAVAEPVEVEPMTTLYVTSRQMDRMFSSLDLEIKARVIQEYLDQYR